MTALLDSVAVLTVSYNSSEALGPFLDSVSTATDGSPVVRIVDNSSLDVEMTARIATEHGAELIRLDSNLGYGGAINVAAKGLPSTVTHLLISNPDVVFEPGGLDHLVAAMDRNPSVGAVGPQVQNSDGTIYPSAREIPSLRNGIGHALLTRIWGSNPWSRRYLSNPSPSDGPREVGWLSGSCLLVRREAFESIAGFDDRFFMYFEDVDLGFRLGRAGWTNWYDPAAVVTHSGAHSTSKHSREMLIAHHESAYQFLALKYPGKALAPLRMILKVALRSRAQWVTRREDA